MAKNAIKNVDDFIADLGDLTLEKVYDLTDKKDVTIRQLNLPNLVKQLVEAAFRLAEDDPSRNNVSYTASEKRLVNTFLSDFNATIQHFMDFLDYDGDNQVKLVEFEKTKGTIDVGKDLEEFLADMKDIGSSIKTSASPQEKVFDVLSKIFLFLISEEFNESREDITNFVDSVKVSINSLKALKTINHKKVFDSKIDDMISFVIAFCVVLVPIVDLIEHKLAELNRSDSNEEHIVLTNEDIQTAIRKTYGDRLEFVLAIMTQLSNQMIKLAKSEKLRRNIQKFLCGCCGQTD